MRWKIARVIGVIFTIAAFGAFATIEDSSRYVSLVFGIGIAYLTYMAHQKVKDPTKKVKKRSVRERKIIVIDRNQAISFKKAMPQRLAEDNGFLLY